MRIAILLLTFVLLGIPAKASACRYPPDTDFRELERQDVALQRRLAVELADLAEDIFVGRALSSHQGNSVAEFEVVESLKGNAIEIVSFPFEGTITIGCGVSSGFRNVFLKPGTLHIVYVSQGVVVRSDTRARIKQKLSFREERRILRRLRDDRGY